MASGGPAGLFAGHLSRYTAPGAPKSRDCPITQAGLVIHGGAGAISRAKTTPAIVQEYRSALQATLARGSAILADGGSALDEGFARLVESDRIAAAHPTAYLCGEQARTALAPLEQIWNIPLP